MSVPAFAPRSMLFVPADRTDMIAKVPRWAPDAVVVDLEDAVAPGSKEDAREVFAEAIAAVQTGLAPVLVRVNSSDTPWYADDVRAVAASTADGVVLPKYTEPGQCAALRAALPPNALVIVGLETARGVADSRDLLAAGPDGVYFGAEDLVAELGGRRTEGGLEVLYARSRVLLAARLAGVAAIDQAVVAVRDDARFRVDAEQGRSLGYQGKICLHPAQVALAHEVFTPTETEIEHAHAVLRAGADGVGVVDGEMVDGVHLRTARTVLTRAGVNPCGSD